MEQDLLVDLVKLEKNIFEAKNGKIFIGREEIKPELLDVLRTQAHNFKTSELYDTFHATLLNESYDLALNQSQNWDHVQFAKALKHMVFVLDNMLLKLKK